MNKRILHFTAGSGLTDLSVPLNDYNSTPTSFPNESGDFLYIGSKLPFNSFYAKISGNDAPVIPLIEYWSEGGWNEVVETFDETQNFLSSGTISFIPNRDYKWKRSSTNYGGQSVMGLETLNIYDMFWIRISMDTVNPATLLHWIGDIFSNDMDLAGEFPDLVRSSVKAAFKSGKTDWEEQHAIAGKMIVNDLINKGLIDSGDQLLEKKQYVGASVCKVAELIFASFGDDSVDDKKRARDEYNNRLVKRINVVDLDADGRANDVEIKNTSGWLSR